MSKCIINTNTLYMLANKDRGRFYHSVRKIIGKRTIVILHGNCQTHALRKILGSNKEFARHYVMCETPRLWMKEDDPEWELFYESGILKLAQFLFTQDISSQNRWGYTKSTEYIISQVSDSCSIVTISKLFFMGYFPQLRLTHMDNKVSFYGGKIQWLDLSVCIDKEVLKWILDDSTQYYRKAEEIVEIISSDDYFKKNRLQQMIEAELEDFALREEKTEIKMCDYLKANYDKFLMFVTNVHPTKKVLEEFALRILKRLQIKDLTIEDSDEEVLPPMPPANKNMFTIYPSVLKAFSFSERSYNLHVSLWGVELPILMGVKPELDEFINENRKEEKKYSMTLYLDFKQYMLLSVRVLQAAIHV